MDTYFAIDDPRLVKPVICPICGKYGSPREENGNTIISHLQERDLATRELLREYAHTLWQTTPQYAIDWVADLEEMAA